MLLVLYIFKPVVVLYIHNNRPRLCDKHNHVVLERAFVAETITEMDERCMKRIQPPNNRWSSACFRLVTAVFTPWSDLRAEASSGEEGWVGEKDRVYGADALT